MSIILQVDGLLGKITGTVYGGQVKSVVIKNRELVHGLFPISACPVPLSGDVTQSQPDQLQWSQPLGT
jgi:hypothetical protein